MKISIETLWHKVYHVEVENSLTIKELKKKLMNKFGLPSSHQHLIIKDNGKWLQNEDAQLQDYGIKEKSLIILSIPQGCSRLYPLLQIFHQYPHSQIRHHMARIFEQNLRIFN